jgi:peptidoglycan hydrolase CwlO-like protein
MLRPKPRVVRDIHSCRQFASRSPRTVFEFIPGRVNLAYRREVRLAAGAFLKTGIIITSLWFLILGSVAAPTITPTLAAPPASEEERKALEAELKELESQIERYENQIISYQKQGKTLKNEIASLDSKIAKLNLQIKAINLTLRELDNKISETQAQILATERSIENKRQVLMQILKNLYESDQATLVEIFLRNPRLSDFFSDINNLTLLQNNLRVTIAEITDLREELVNQKEQYDLARADAETLRNYQESQKAETDAVKKQKSQLLAITKGQESKYQELLKETQKTAAQIRSRIFELLGGGELSFGEAYNLAKIAESATGIRASFLLAVLDRESALGRNVGKCSYRTAMHPTRDLPLFFEITSQLNINPDSITVSCPIVSDGTYGGAMGPAQFLPSTWMLYKDKIESITGRSPANPWNNADAFVATALYLKDAMQGCKAIYDNALSQERCAAAKYYAGGRWRSYLWTYGEAVISRARRFEQDIIAITS